MCLQQIHLSAKISLEHLDQTTDLEIEPEGNGLSIPANAFLIVNGTEVFPLTQSVINIGRRTDNQLVIDDPRISACTHSFGRLKVVTSSLTWIQPAAPSSTINVIQGIPIPGGCHLTRRRSARVWSGNSCLWRNPKIRCTLR